MSWDDELKIGLKQVALAHMDAFQASLSRTRPPPVLGADLFASFRFHFAELVLLDVSCLFISNVRASC